MPDQDYQQAVAGLRAMRPQYTEDRIKVTGDGVNDDPTTGAQAGNLWVRGYPRGAAVQVLIGPNINPHVKDVRVYVGQNHARQAVAHDVVVDKNATDQWGAGLPTLTQQANISTMALIPGRAQASDKGGLYVHVNGFDYDDGVFLGGTWSAGTFDPTTYDFDISADVPVTTGYSVWVRFWFDPSDATLHALAGTPIFTGNNPWMMDETAISNIPIPTGSYPTGAVVLTYGQTTLAGAYFASNRYFLGKREIEVDQILTGATGYVLVGATGHVLTGARA